MQEFELKAFLQIRKEIAIHARSILSHLNLIEENELYLLEEFKYNHNNVKLSTYNLIKNLKLIDDFYEELENIEYDTLIEKIKTICHDLRSPVGTIQGYSQMMMELMEQEENSYIKDKINKILQISKEILILIEKINIYSSTQYSDLSDMTSSTLNQDDYKNQQIIEKNNHVILVVDDHEQNRNLLYDWLNRKGYQVLIASNGAEAVVILNHHNIDIILLDMVMPQMDGFQFLNYIKNQKMFFEIFIIVISALNEPEKIVNCIKLGAEDYLIKPFNSFLLEARINACLEKKSLRNQEKKFTNSLLEEKNYINNIISSMNNMLIVTDTDLNIQTVNPSVHETLHYKESLVGKNLSNLFASQRSWRSFHKKILKHKQDKNIELMLKRSDDIAVPTLLSYSHLMDSNNELKNIIFVARDISEIQAMQIQTKKAYSLLRTTIESTKEGILTIDNNLNIVEYNRKFLEIWDLKSKNLKNINFIQLKKLIHDKLFEPGLHLTKLELFLKDFSCEIIDKWHLHNDNVIEIYSQPQLLEKNTIGRIFCFRDITETYNLERQLTYQATHDNLTGLHNRAFLTNQIDNYFEEAYKQGSILGIVLFDLDNFKNINDTFGHDTGDLLLQNISVRLRSCLYKTDIVIRLGGDEFVIVISAKTEEEITLVVDKIKKIVSEPLYLNKHLVNVSASIGISLYPHDGIRLNSLLKKADIALYNVKECGRNNYKYYHNNLEVISPIKSNLARDLKQAFLNNEFELYYQPVIDINKNTIIATEVLLRWKHPKYGLLLPERFLSLADKMGLMESIDKWVIENSCLQNVKWRDEGLNPMIMMINISSFQLNSYYNLEEIIRTTLNKTGINPESIGLELTETNLISNNPILIKTLKNLKNLGLSIAIDDFGTGYSNLNYIRNFPIDTIKIDRIFFKDICDDFKNKTIISAITQMASILNINIIAEGIEHQEQLDYLKENFKDQIKLVQGFHFYRPMTASKIKALLVQPHHNLGTVME